MQGLKRYSNDVVRLDLTSPSSTSSATNTTNLSIDGEESAETKIQRLISEHPVIIFSRSSCYMCHVMRKLLANIGVHPTVIELDDHEISALPLSADSPRKPAAPAVFIGGTCIGGLESLFALHLSGHLVPKLVEAGALWENEGGMRVVINLGRETHYKWKLGPVSFGFGKDRRWVMADDSNNNYNNPQPQPFTRGTH